VALPGGSQSDVVGNGVDVSYATARLSLARRMSQRIENTEVRIGMMAQMIVVGRTAARGMENGPCGYPWLA